LGGNPMGLLRRVVKLTANCSTVGDTPVSGVHDERDTLLDERQRRELDFHREFADRHREKITQAVALDVIEPGPRRPWNGYWTAYDLLMAEGLAGKRVMIPGCGFGEDA